MTKSNYRSIAIYGKGGIGKSTIASNLSAALSLSGAKVMQIGCDPKRDSVSLLCGGLIPSVLDVADRVSDEEILLDRVIKKGFNGILCVESGGPRPGTGCAGRGVAYALELLERNNVFERYEVDFIIYDILGDVVCGGFAQPLKEGFADEVYVVTSGELFSLVQLNNICMSIFALAENGAKCRLKGIINNMRGVPFEKDIVEKIGALMGIEVVSHIPRSETIQKAEKYGKTVIEKFPQSEQAKMYFELAQFIVENRTKYAESFKPLLTSEIRQIISEYSRQEEDGKNN
ncbi:MAG: nitrogenase iron protein [Candidatus Schekmanbacteria bacterium]|nr:MAG: nitrogenase iron protein [Candidatus Schekmanbacteria bacterium]